MITEYHHKERLVLPVPEAVTLDLDVQITVEVSVGPRGDET